MVNQAVRLRRVWGPIRAGHHKGGLVIVSVGYTSGENVMRLGELGDNVTVCTMFTPTSGIDTVSDPV